MSKLKVYYMKEKDPNKWAEAGFDIYLNEPYFGGWAIFLEKKIPKEDIMAVRMIENYDSESMLKNFYSPDSQEYYTSIGVNYFKDENGNLKLDRECAKLIDTVTTVRLVIYQADGDKLLHLAPTSDWLMPIRIPAAKLIDPYFKDEIDRLVKSGVVGVRYMEETIQ